MAKKQDIYWITDEDGEKRRIGQSNPMQLKRKAISPAGNVIEISLANGKAQTRRLGNMYADIVEAEKTYRGWVWYHSDDCPPVPAGGVEHMDAKDAKKLCKNCQAQEALIAARKAAHNEIAADYDAMFRGEMDKMAEAISKLAAAQGASLHDLKTDDLQKQAPKPKADRVIMPRDLEGGSNA